ncbi:MAG TPA: hypothetical protein VKF35_24250 [Hyphomicrobiaceae bacterium]|nr:hypothetical protein [Hyphomicrobiaceae bacterium]
MVFIRNRHIVNSALYGTAAAGAFAISGLLLGGPAYGASGIAGQVLGAGAPIANSTVTSWAASAEAPRQLEQTHTGPDGRFTLNADTQGADVYITANGGRPTANPAAQSNPVVTLLAVLGSTPPASVIVNEMTTIASVWTNAQFLDGTTLKGNPLGLGIAAGNVPNFVDVATGGYGVTIQDALNSGQTPTMANFATLATVLAGCVTQVKPDACDQFFAATTPRSGKTPADTLTALEGVARDSSYKPERLFALLNAFYPIPSGKNLRPVPFTPISPGHRAPGRCRSSSAAAA